MSPTLMMVCTFEADDLKDAFVRHCVIFTKAGFFFSDPEFCSRMLRTLTTSTTTSSSWRAIIMALGVRAKWQLGKTMQAVSVLHTT